MQNDFIQTLQTVTQLFFLPFTKSKGTQNVSRGIRLPKPRKEFHALTKESFSDAVIISSHLLPLRESMRGSMQTSAWPEVKHNGDSMLLL